jgi:hypothetical protein
LFLIQVNSSVQPLSSYKHSHAQGVKLFGVADWTLHTEDNQFPCYEINELGGKLAKRSTQLASTMSTVAGIMKHMGATLALRCMNGEPMYMNNEAIMREYITPILYAVQAMTDGVHLSMEHTVQGTRASGSIDYALLYKDSPAVAVIQVRQYCLVYIQILYTLLSSIHYSVHAQTYTFVSHGKRLTRQHCGVTFAACLSA